MPVVSGYRHVESAMAFEPTDGYVSLREQCPVHFEADHDPPFFVVTRYDDVITTLRDAKRWRNGDGPGVFFQEGGVLGSADDPDHARQRRVLRDDFLPVRIAGLRDELTEITDALLDEFLPHGSGDLVEALAFPLPALAIGALLGVAPERRRSFHHASLAVVNALTGGDLQAMADARSELHGVIDDEMDRRAALGDDRPRDVLTTMYEAEQAGRLRRSEVRQLGLQLLVAGHETTASLIGLLMYRLLERPELMARVRADLSLLPAAIEEALRFDSPVHGLFRTNDADAEIAGCPVPARTKVQLSYASANRDPARWSDPESFRLDRDPDEARRHLAFGWGVHHCIGAPLARLETTIAFERLLARTTRIELDGQPERNPSFLLHGLTSLPIRWDVTPS